MVEGGRRYCRIPRPLATEKLPVAALHFLPKRAGSRWAASSLKAAGSSLAVTPEKIRASLPILWRYRETPA